METFSKDEFKNKVIEEYDFFVENFPEHKILFEKLQKKPGCGVCIKNVVDPFKNDSKAIEKLKNLIGDYEIKSESRWVQNAGVRAYTEDEYKKFFVSNFGREAPPHQIRTYSTYYNPETKKVVVSYQWMVKEEV